jgi:hypothetical protein
MQKVVGSSPIIRFTKAPLSGVSVSCEGTKDVFCKRNCKRERLDAFRTNLNPAERLGSRTLTHASDSAITDTLCGGGRS